ncbi:DUF2637 domain-containing protein [Streptomyces verrucosisporus]|uniref:DUF2637 domain-containing protein n=1 Tax=Streptomyces verrucosisporus TaxID=1695161 RepID=UPI0019D13649|nr:DUF2637 domain-containing protein [Streptomyces verrucosisporus]MBN3932767.1 DUF2637 domain-containing protein [Streptomyces verrucosisporus]
MTRTHRILIGVVVAGAVVIAAIGFAGSYAAVRDLAEQKGFGGFAPFFPIGIDAGIVVLLALDLLLTWIRIPFPMLRQTAWLLTAATIAFNGAAAWPDPLGVGMHAVIPVLFVVAVEAARHAVGRIADITADKHMEGVRLSRWLLAFPSTFRLWRRMKLWELRSYDQVIRMEQDRLIYEARLRARYGRAWKRRAPVEALMPLRLARYGVPLAETGPAGLAAAGIDPQALPATGGKAAVTGGKAAVTGGKAAAAEALPAGTSTERAPAPGSGPGGAPVAEAAGQERHELLPPSWRTAEERGAAVREVAHGPVPSTREAVTYVQAAPAEEAASARETVPRNRTASEEAPAAGLTIPRDPANPDGPHRPLGGAPSNGRSVSVPGQYTARPEAEAEVADEPVGIPDGMPREDAYYRAYHKYIVEKSDFPNPHQLALTLLNEGIKDANGGPLSESYLRPYVHEFKDRYRTGLGG